MSVLVGSWISIAYWITTVCLNNTHWIGSRHGSYLFNWDEALVRFRGVLIWVGCAPHISKSGDVNTKLEVVLLAQCALKRCAWSKCTSNLSNSFSSYLLKFNLPKLVKLKCSLNLTYLNEYKILGVLILSSYISVKDL